MDGGQNKVTATCQEQNNSTRRLDAKIMLGTAGSQDPKISNPLHSNLTSKPTVVASQPVMADVPDGAHAPSVPQDLSDDALTPRDSQELEGATAPRRSRSQERVDKSTRPKERSSSRNNLSIPEIIVEETTQDVQDLSSTLTLARTILNSPEKTLKPNYT